MNDAEAFALRSLDRAREFEQRALEPRILLILGDVAAHREPSKIDEAETRYRRALGLAEEMGMRPLAGFCRLALGVLYRRLGRTSEARAELATAAGLFRTMEMTYWLARAEDALIEL